MLVLVILACVVYAAMAVRYTVYIFRCWLDDAPSWSRNDPSEITFMSAGALFVGALWPFAMVFYTIRNALVRAVERIDN